MNLSRFIAKRIYTSEGEKREMSRPAVLIAMAGIAVGIAVMIISIAVVMGFKKEVSGKVTGFGSDIQVLSLTQDMNYQMLPVVTNDSLLSVINSIDGVKSVEEFATIVGLLKTEDSFRAVQIKGVGENYNLAFFRQYLTEGTIPEFSSSDASYSLLISQKIAGDLGISVGDRVYAYFISNAGMKARRFTVSGIYETNLTDYDRNITFTDIATVRRLSGWKSDESSGYQISVDDFSQVDGVTQRLVDRVNHRIDRNGATYGAFSIKEISPSIFAWLDVLDTNVIMILVLMLCVAIFTIVSGLLIVMLERINMIGLLKAIGMTNLQVRKIFMHFAVMTVGHGLFWGNVIALAFCALQYYCHIITLDASVYYIDFVPISFEWLHFIVVNVVTLAISSLVIFGSSFFMSLGKPAKTIKFD